MTVSAGEVRGAKGGAGAEVCAVQRHGGAEARRRGGAEARRRGGAEVRWWWGGEVVVERCGGGGEVLTW